MYFSFTTVIHKNRNITVLPKNSAESGFTILEISIVLSVLALLTGAILAGKSLIGNAEIKTVVQQAGQFSLVTNQFYTEYKALPGDMENATDFWGAADADNDACKLLDKSGMVETCNGNGNGDITANNYEPYLYWQHLKNANFIEGDYSGTANHGCGAAPNCKFAHLPGVNSPVVKINGVSAGWGMKDAGYQDGVAPNNNWFIGQYSHSLFFGASNSGNALPINPSLTPRQLWSLDKKLDDGKPAQGIIVTRTSEYNPVADCTVEAEGSTAPSAFDDMEAAYNLKNDNIVCNFMLRNLFE